MGRRFLAVLSVLLLAFLPTSAFAQPIVGGERRVALVIANSNYSNATKLQNTVADGRAMENALKQRGFEVLAGYDLDRYGMLRTIEEFLNRLSSGTIAIVYFSGHGVQLDGQNYLLPIDVKPESRSVLAYDGYPLGRLIEQMTATRNKFSLAIVDACRDNPFPIATRSLGTTRGLAAPTTAAGAMVVYSAGANQQAIDNLGMTDPNPNGLFTREFLRVIAEPGLSIRDAISKVKLSVASAAESIGQRQTPAIYDESTGDFIFTPRTAMAVIAPTPRPATAPQPAPDIVGPSERGFSLDDLVVQDAEAKAKWDAWQTRMRGDFEKVAVFQGSDEMRRTAWDRFLSAYGDENPYSNDDDGLRERALSSRGAITDVPKVAGAGGALQEFIQSIGSQPVRRAYIGVNIQSLSEDIANGLGMTKDKGNIVAGVEPGGPAALAGIRQGDVIITVNGEEVGPSEGLATIIGKSPIGSQIPIQIIRGGQRLTVAVIPGERPPKQPAATRGAAGKAGNNAPRPASEQSTRAAAIGLGFETLTLDLARWLGVPSTTQGVMINYIDSAGTAAPIGFQPGDVILQVNNVAATTGEAAATYIEDARKAGRGTVLLFVQRGNDPPRYIGVALKN
jgi:hypothetical protein